MQGQKPCVLSTRDIDVVFKRNVFNWKHIWRMPDRHMVESGILSPYFLSDAQGKTDVEGMLGKTSWLKQKVHPYMHSI